MNYALTFNECRRLFCIDDDTGVVYRKITTSSRSRKGEIVGSLNKSTGYLEVSINHKKHTLHTVVWIYYHGYKPENVIDHCDKSKLNNRIDNLREVSQLCNIRNQPIQQNNTSGVCGVHKNKKYNRWYSQIAINYKNYHLGYHNTFEEAVFVRFAAEQCLGWDHCNNRTTALLYVQSVLNK